MAGIEAEQNSSGADTLREASNAVLALILLATAVSAARAQRVRDLIGTGIRAVCPTNVYQGAKASDAFSAIHYLGGGRVIAGKRSSGAWRTLGPTQDGTGYTLTFRDLAPGAARGFCRVKVSP